MKKPEEYKCHEIMTKYSNSHSHEDFQFDSEIIFKKEDLEKVFNECGFTPYKRTGHSNLHYHKDGVSTNEHFWDFSKDVRLREINEMYLINEVTKAKVRYCSLKYFGEFVLYEMIERFECFFSWRFMMDLSRLSVFSLSTNRIVLRISIIVFFIYITEFQVIKHFAKLI